MSEFRYTHILSYVRETPWAILPSKLAVILDLLAFRATGERLTADQVQERIGAVTRAVGSPPPGIAVLPLLGVIGHRAGTLHEQSGGTSVERFTQTFRLALADSRVGAIVLDVDSPGGAVSGVEELSTEIYRARGRKPVVAVANSLAASAAYWIATAAGEIVVTPSGEVGSIGVLAAHEDLSGAQEQAGVRTTLISAGKYKAEGSPFEPLTLEARAYVQERVDEYYGMFVRAVARNRDTSADAVRGGYGEGRVVGARQALSLGMADRIGTLDETIARVEQQLRKSPPGNARAAAGDLDVRQRRFRLTAAASNGASDRDR